MTTEADLLAQIAANPDDDAAYAVYGDLLQSRGDPRGELIALGDDRPAIDKFVEAHREALLGRLAMFVPMLSVEWHRGFVRAARVVTGLESHALQIVSVLADAPASQFLRRLEIVLGAKRPSYAAIDAALVRRARPATLVDIVLGRPGEHVASPALRAAFPQLRGDDPWPSVVRALAKARPPASAIIAAQLPVPSGPRGVALPIEPAAVLAGLAVEIGKRKPIGVAAALATSCTRAALDDYAAALVTAYGAAGATPVDAWALDAAAVLGGPRTAQALGRRAFTFSHQRGVQALDAIARIAHPYVALELFAASRGHQSRCKHADELLGRLGGAGKQTIGGLLARAGTIEPFADADAARRFIQLDDDAIEWLMTTGWTARPRGALAWFVESKVRGERNARLVWVRHRGDAYEPFRWRAGEPVDVDGQPIALAGDDVVSIAHPALLSAAQLAGWSRALPERPPVQLDRALPLRDPSFDGLSATIADRGVATLDVLHRRGFRDGEIDYETQQLAFVAKTYRWRGVDYRLAINLSSNAVTASHDAPPLVVLHEAARDLAP